MESLITIALLSIKAVNAYFNSKRIEQLNLIAKQNESLIEFSKKNLFKKKEKHFEPSRYNGLCLTN